METHTEVKPFVDDPFYEAQRKESQSNIKFIESLSNLYVLQVEPTQSKRKDKVLVKAQEAFHVEKMRVLFINKHGEIIKMRIHI